MSYGFWQMDSSEAVMSDDKDAVKAPDVVSKWGAEVAGRGFAQLPNYLLLLNQFLDDDHRLSPVELLLLFQLVGGWWKKESLPFPSIGTLARRCGVSDRQIQRALVRLEKLKLVARTKRRSRRGLIASNAYDLSPLVAVLQQIAKAFPNEFPRAVTRDQRQSISARLTPVNTTSETPVVSDPALQKPPVNAATRITIDPDDNAAVEALLAELDEVLLQNNPTRPEPQPIRQRKLAQPPRRATRSSKDGEQ
jgi:hypothetical protein